MLKRFISGHRRNKTLSGKLKKGPYLYLRQAGSGFRFRICPGEPDHVYSIHRYTGSENFIFHNFFKKSYPVMSPETE